MEEESTESWADLAEDPRALADRAYAEMENNTRERLALNGYLALLQNPHMLLEWSKRNVQSLDGAVTSTPELESYLLPKMTTSILTTEAETPKQNITSPGVGSERQQCMPNDQVASLFDKLVDRVEKLKASQSQAGIRR